MTAVAGCTGTKSSTGNVVSSETETNAEETSAQSEAGTFSSADMFTERDLAGTYEESGAVYVTLSDDGITGETDGVAINGQMVTITAEGTYIFSGTLSEGQIVVDADNAKVQIVFDNVDITCASSAAVYVKSAEKVFVTLAEGSQNTLRNTDEYVAIDDNNIDAVIFAKSDLTLNGTGSLTIISAEGHGIVSKDDLKITGGTYDITAAGHALSGKDSVRIADGTFILTAEKDGIHAENADDEEKGYIYIADGDFTITSDGDGMDASNIVQIEDGTLDITAGGWLVTIGITLFAFSTILGWEYHGEKAFEYLLGTHRFNMVYRLVFSFVVYFGCTQTLNLVWSFSDIANALMAIPNLICMLLLSGEIAKDIREFQKEIHKYN